MWQRALLGVVISFILKLSQEALEQLLLIIQSEVDKRKGEKENVQDSKPTQ